MTQCLGFKGSGGRKYFCWLLYPLYILTHGGPFLALVTFLLVSTFPLRISFRQTLETSVIFPQDTLSFIKIFNLATVFACMLP